MKIIIKANLFVVFVLLLAAGVCVSFALEGGDCLPGWMTYVWQGLAAEAGIFALIGVVYLVKYFAELPPMRRGYITFDERYGWTDEGGYRP
jgi:hypothetical protein